jgi:NCS1 family nucleobase:cation symporter-1
VNKETSAPVAGESAGNPISASQYARTESGFVEVPVSRHDLKGLWHYLSLFAGEHVAGTEFAVGVVFVTWGVSAKEFLIGLLMGNLAVVLLWTFFPALLGTRTRLTLYAFLHRVCGPSMQKIFNLVSGVIYCTMGGAMTTIAASAIRVMFDIPPQVGLYPTDPMFVMLVLAIGAVVAVVAAYGFDAVAKFSGLCAPWLLLVFVMGGMLALPELLRIAGTDGAAVAASGFGGLLQFGDTWIWRPRLDGFTRWHVAAFAIFCTLSLHVGLNDMAIFRYAKKYQYGYSAAIGMFFGHFIAWICSAIMGAAAAGMLKSGIEKLDTGDISYAIMGSVGLLAIVIAGWTTSNPNIYRAGLAFQSVFTKVSVRKVTLITGAATAVIACFPFIFSRLSEYVNIIGLAVEPVGAIAMCEYWLLPALGMTRYWSYYKKQKLNKAALITWVGGLACTVLLGVTGTVDFFFLFVPCFLISCGLYAVLAALLGARGKYSEQEEQLSRSLEKIEAIQDREYAERLKKEESIPVKANCGAASALTACAVLMLAVCLGMAVLVFIGGIDASVYRDYAIFPTLAYFGFAILAYWFGVKKT